MRFIKRDHANIYIIADLEELYKIKQCLIQILEKYDDREISNMVGMEKPDAWRVFNELKEIVPEDYPPVLIKKKVEKIEEVATSRPTTFMDKIKQIFLID